MYINDKCVIYSYTYIIYMKYKFNNKFSYIIITIIKQY